MIISLNAKNKFSFVDEMLPKPDEGAQNEKAWKRCNDMIIGWLIASLETNIAKSVMYFKNASEI